MKKKRLIIIFFMLFLIGCADTHFKGIVYDKWRVQSYTVSSSSSSINPFIGHSGQSPITSSSYNSYTRPPKWIICFSGDKYYKKNNKKYNGNISVKNVCWEIKVNRVDFDKYNIGDSVYAEWNTNSANNRQIISWHEGLKIK